MLGRMAKKINEIAIAVVAIALALKDHVLRKT
jgi:hypothetical protein